jgi:hypothetical protein
MNNLFWDFVFNLAWASLLFGFSSCLFAAAFNIIVRGTLSLP